MPDINTEFIMELFLDDNIFTMNRLIVATADVVNDNIENISFINDALLKEYDLITPPISRSSRSSINVSQLSEQKYYERTVKKFTDEEYYDKFKMRKSTVEALITFLKEYVRPDCAIVPLDKKVHIFLWLLANDSSLKEMAELFGLHKSSVSYIFHEIAILLAEQKNQFINWPSSEEQHVTRIKVNSKFGFPNCIGFIDACSFKIGSKRKRKEKPKIILLQAVCDETLMFIDIHIGEIGVTRKSKVFRESELVQKLKNLIDFDNHILGDSEYKLRKNLITPYTSEQLVTSEEMRFNAVHWKTQSYIRQAFEILRDRFTKLTLIDINKVEAVKTLICAACVVHNFVLFHEGSPVKEELVLNDEGLTIDTDVVNTAAEKRQYLCNYINYIQNSNSASAINNCN